MRSIRYREIADDIRRRLAGGEFGPGELLPSEANLVDGYDASRVTIRKSLEVLRSEGLVESRQGFGWIASGQLLRQSLESLQSIESQLADVGRAHERNILDFRFVDADTVDSKVDIAPILGERVLEVRRISQVDGRPFARVTVWCREALAHEVTVQDVTHSSFYDLLPVAAKAATQTIGAEPISTDDGTLLGVPAATPALVVRRTTFDADDQPILMAEHVFPGHLTEFAATLSGSAGTSPADSPTLRLVGDEYR